MSPRTGANYDNIQLGQVPLTSLSQNIMNLNNMKVIPKILMKLKALKDPPRKWMNKKKNQQDAVDSSNCNSMNNFSRLAKEKLLNESNFLSFP